METPSSGSVGLPARSGRSETPGSEEPTAAGGGRATADIRTDHGQITNVDEVLALDLLTLVEHTERAGDVFDPETQRAKLVQSFAVCEVLAVRREGALVAYAMLARQEDDRWFVLGFNTHPGHRNAAVFRDLFAQIAALAQRCAISSLRSNVYWTNRLSIAFHRRLGFRETRRNSKGVEFTATLADLVSATPALNRPGPRRA